MNKKKYDSVETIDIDEEDGQKIRRPRRSKKIVVSELAEKLGRFLILLASESTDSDESEKLLALAREARILKAKIDE